MTKANWKIEENKIESAFPPLVNCPTRWSLLFIFGFLCWSSSWWWWPHIGGGKKFRPLLRAGLTVLVQFFCKMYILWVSWSRKKILADFFWVLPPQKRRFFQRGAKMSEKGAGPLFWHFEIHWNHSGLGEGVRLNKMSEWGAVRKGGWPPILTFWSA